MIKIYKIFMKGLTPNYIDTLNWVGNRLVITFEFSALEMCFKKERRIDFGGSNF